MKNEHDEAAPLKVAVEGVVAGMLGALAITVMVRAGRAAMGGRNQGEASQHDAGISAAEALSEAPDMPPNMNQVTATFVQKIATGIFGTSLTSRQQYVAGTAWHLAYGGFWSMLYALLQSSVPIPKVLLAPVWGFNVWVIGPG